MLLGRASSREMLCYSIPGVLNQCMGHTFVTAPDVTIDIYEDAELRNQ